MHIQSGLTEFLLLQFFRNGSYVSLSLRITTVEKLFVCDTL